jgi:hypothetical protein
MKRIFTNRYFLQGIFLSILIIIAALVLSSCGSGPSATPTATPDAAECKSSFVSTISGAILEARTEEDFKAAMKKLGPESFPACAGLPAPQKAAIRNQAITELAPMLMAADWYTNPADERKTQ